MTEAETKVYNLLMNWRGLLTAKEILSTCDEFSPAQKKERAAVISRILAVLEALMPRLSDDERFVVKRHLIDGITWEQTVYEYNHHLLRSREKSSSSLRRLQKQAIVKLAQNTKQLRELELPI